MVFPFPLSFIMHYYCIPHAIYNIHVVFNKYYIFKYLPFCTYNQPNLQFLIPFSVFRGHTRCQVCSWTSVQCLGSILCEHKTWLTLLRWSPGQCVSALLITLQTLDVNKYTCLRTSLEFPKSNIWVWRFSCNVSSERFHQNLVYNKIHF